MPSPPIQRQKDGSMPLPLHPLLLQIRLLVDAGTPSSHQLGFWDGACGLPASRVTLSYRVGYEGGALQGAAERAS